MFVSCNRYIENITLKGDVEVNAINRGMRALGEYGSNRVRWMQKNGLPEPSFRSFVENTQLSVEETVKIVV